MKKNHRILIIENHKLIIEGHKNVLKQYLPGNNLIIDSAYDCDSAIEKIEKSSFDLIVLDIIIPASKINPKIASGEELGVWLKKNNPNVKIIVITSYNDNYRINSILKSINPNSFLLKAEMSVVDLTNSIKTIIDDDEISYYGDTVKKLVRKKVSSTLRLDYFDLQILREISSRTRNSDLAKFIGLSKVSIEKRKKKLKEYFGIINGTDRDLILAARDKCY